jgi:hypothetical protein
MSEVGAVAPGPLRLRVWHAVTALGALGLLSELFWQLRFDVGSPLRALTFVALAVSTGDLYRRRTLGAGRTRGLGQSFVAGFVLSSTLYLTLRILRAPTWSIVLLLVALGAWGFKQSEWRTMLMRRLDPLSVVAWLPALFIVAYGEWLMDGPQLTQAHPTRFIWVDTPLWLNFAYGLERGVPARELLFKGGQINDAYGSGFLPLWIRETTGLGMHTAYSTAVMLTGLLMGSMLRTFAQLLYRPDRAGRLLLSRVAPLLGALWFQRWVHNFPSLLGQALLLYAWIELARATRWRSLWLLLPTTLLLMLSNEACYFAFLIGAAMLASFRFYRESNWKPLAFTILAVAATRIVYRPLLHPAQGVQWGLAEDRLNAQVLWHTLAIEQVLPPYSFAAIDVLVAALALASILLCWRRSAEVYVMLWSAGIVTAMTGITFAMQPRFKPALSADEDHWVVVSMYNFHRIGSHVAVLVLLCGALVALSRARRVRSWPKLSAALLIALALQHSEGSYNLIAQPDPSKPISDDPVLPLLERIDPKRSLIAAQVPWGQENPSWAAYFGHRFFCLRRGRWTPAYGRYTQIVAAQDAIFAARNLGEVATITRREGITHVIVDKLQSTAWAGLVRPEVESNQHAVYNFAPSRTR